MIGLVRATPLLALALVASCGKAPDEEASIADLDNALAQVNGAASANDPVLQSALKDQIMVDPALVQQANADTVRPPMQPESGAVPPDGIASAAMTGEKDDVRPAPPPGECKQCALARQLLSRGAQATARGGAANCAGNVAYSAAWANRLPAGVPLYPDARVAEAAGADADGCALRVVSFASAAPPERLLAWYFTKASDGGYRAEHALRGGEHVLGGTKSGGAFLLTVKPRKGGGSDVDLMADAGA